MARDVLTLDVEIDPSSVMRQREALRMGLSQDLSGSIPGIMGGPYGGMGPGINAYPAMGFGQTVGTALFPGFFAPPNTTVDAFERASTFYRERAFGDTAFGVGRSLLETGGEVVGGGFGAGVGAAIGGLFGGKAGAALGGFGGLILGSALGGGAADIVGGELQNIREGNKGIQNALVQLGYKAGLNVLGDDDGGDRTRALSYQLAGDAARNPLVALTGMDPRQLVSQVVQSGLQNNFYGQIDTGDVDQDLSSFREAVKRDVDATVRISQALRTTISETRAIMEDLRRGGVTDAEQQNLDVGLLSSGFQFGADPSQLMTVRNLGTQSARASYLPGSAGGRETLIQGLRLAEMRQQGFLSEEVVQAGGGIGNLAAGIQAGANRQLGEGGILRDLVFASMSEGGGIDAKKFSQLSGRSALEIRQAAARQFFSGGDPVEKLEEFNLNYNDLVQQLSNEDPGAIGQAFRLQIDRAARTSARTTGRRVTNATRFAAAQNFFGLDPNTARALVQSGGASQADDPLALIERLGERADADIARRSQDPGVQLRALTSRLREEVGAPLVQGAEQGAVELQRYFGGKLKGLAESVLGMENLSPEERRQKLDEQLKIFNAQLNEGDPNAPEGSAAARGLKGIGIESAAGKDALSTLAARSGNVIDLLQQMVNQLASFANRVRAQDPNTVGGTGPTSSPAPKGTPAGGPS